MAGQRQKQKKKVNHDPNFWGSGLGVSGGAPTRWSGPAAGHPKKKIFRSPLIPLLFSPLVLRAIAVLAIPSFWLWVHTFRGSACKPYGGISCIDLYPGRAEFAFKEVILHNTTLLAYFSSINFPDIS